MTDIKYRLTYRGVNWEKVHKRQDKKWADKSGDVMVISAADPEKLKEFRAQRNAQGLNISRKKKKRKKNRVNKK